MDIISKVCSSETHYSSVFEQWKVLVVDESWKQRLRLSKILSPFFSKVELVFDVSDALEYLDEEDEVDLVILWGHLTSKEAVTWLKKIKEFKKRPKVLLCDDVVTEELESTANAIAADGCIAITENDEQLLTSLAKGIGQDFEMPAIQEPEQEKNEPTVAEELEMDVEADKEKEGMVKPHAVEATIMGIETEAEQQEDGEDEVPAILAQSGTIAIPEPSEIVLELRELFQRDKRTRAEEIEEVINRDYKLKNRVLKLVGASFFGVKVKTKISSVSHAINLIGMKPVVNFAYLISLNTASAVRTGKITDFAYKYWKYGLASGIACVNLHPHLGSLGVDFDSSDAFLLGAIHNLGILLIAKEFPDEYPHMMAEFWRKHHSGEGQCELEQEEYGFDHTHVSMAVAKEWLMPHEFFNAIAHHHDYKFEAAEKRQKVLHDMLLLSDFMTNHYMYNNFDFTLLNKRITPIAKGFGESLDSLKKMKELIRTQLMANINLIG